MSLKGLNRKSFDWDHSNSKRKSEVEVMKRSMMTQLQFLENLEGEDLRKSTEFLKNSCESLLRLLNENHTDEL